MLALLAIVAAAPAGPEPHQHVLAAPGARAPDRVALLAGATPDLWSEAAAASEHARAALLSSKAKASDVVRFTPYTVAERQSDDAERWRECRLAGHEGRHRRRQ